jgi:endoglucanase
MLNFRDNFSRPVAALLGTLALSLVLQAADAAPTPAIKVDQVGYAPKSPKVAVVTSFGTEFIVKKVKDGSKVLDGTLAKAVADKDSGDNAALADFSSLTVPGEYYVEVPGVGQSWPFTVKSDVFKNAYYMAARAFYGQRCGTEVDLGKGFEAFKYPACHLHGEFHASSGKTGRKDNVGGWHDAGDYGRYVVNSSISVANLMWAWDLYGAKIKSISLHIPESGQAAPDLLGETRWNLEWMLKMQDADGGVFHKQTSESFIGFIAPNEDKTVQYVVGNGSEPFKSTCATADFAASMALAARIYKPFNPGFAKEALKAAEKAWVWAEAHPNVTFKNPKGVLTGEYGDAECSDELLWASAELWRTTGKKIYNTYFLAHWSGFQNSLKAVTAENWREVAPMGLWAYAMAKQKGTDAAVVAAIKKGTVEAASAFSAQTEANPYRVSLLTKDYVWGSTSVAASYGIELMIADRFSPDPKFRAAAADNLHYILGRNPFSMSLVTQVGSNAFSHPHHRPSAGTGKAWPGLMSGGPNAGRQDPDLAKLAKEVPPAKCWMDVQGSYAGNEIAINWQSALVFLLASQL